jgi:hypothetical protein
MQNMTQPSRKLEYLFPEEPVQIEICSKQGIEQEVWWSEFRGSGERGPPARDASAAAAAGIRQKIMSRYKTKSLNIDSGRHIDVYLRSSPGMPMFAEKFNFGLLRLRTTIHTDRYEVAGYILERTSPTDGGPAFSQNALRTLSVSIGDSYQTVNADSVEKTKDGIWWESILSFSSPPHSNGSSFEFTVVSEREVSNAQWQYINRSQSSALNLLENVERTGYVIIVGKVGLSRIVNGNL